MGDLRILGRVTSINMRKVLWTADLIGTEYVTELWGLPHRDPHEPEYLALNPNALVPVIIDDGFVLWESNAIMRYLADTRRSGLWPVGAKERALVDQWLTWQVAELNAQWGYAVQALMRRNPAFTDEGRIAESIRKWTAAMQILENQLIKGGGYVANHRMSIADLAVALSAHRWFSTPFEHPDFPAIRDHYEKLKATPEGQKYMSAETP
ncbi:glutathione S-transferase N-terminal domain-containing protein [Devosia sp. ZB163]|uniref:glutathione S-transferase family protein n=1 Tax=Devosia sp. ZB163 TaxID=3025938 RepID=UPI00235FA3C9|nr:glutathione S-transferase N-terminal domain-containing protein [Devosia sp. ZB163]MDC9825216.1 glutathione S-transferase N-terminal domain-containing protein [Devosia sp. ZB163]